MEVAYAYERVSNEAGVYAAAKEHPEGNWGPILPARERRALLLNGCDLFVRTAAPGASLEWLRD